MTGSAPYARCTDQDDEAARLARLSSGSGRGREAGQLQERDEACNLLALHTQDKEAEELIDACLGLPPVEPESRATIGARRKQVPRMRVTNYE